MQRHLHTKGIILRKTKQSEYDELVTFYSPELGKINAIAKGGRKITSHFCGHLETLNICQFQLYKSHYRFTITQAITTKNFKNIRNNFKMTMKALMALEIFQKSTSSEESIEGEKLFHLLEETLEKLETSDTSLLTLEGFKLKLLENLGVLPDITVCSICQKRWEPASIIYLNQDNHLVCLACKPALPVSNSQRIDFTMIKLMNFLLRNEALNKKINLTKEEAQKLEVFTNIFLYNYINQEIYSQRITNQFSD